MSEGYRSEEGDKLWDEMGKWIKDRKEKEKENEESIKKFFWWCFIFLIILGICLL
tara:strand:+ start:877 stop:1041 length:165 start_codon:yes stop_codon:yes gene_type:complete